MKQTQPRPRMAILSHVLPFPSKGGQQQRVRNKLLALSEHFHLTFITKGPSGEIERIRDQLCEYCDNAIILPSCYARNLPVRLWYHLLGYIFSLKNGLKNSNYILGQVEFSPSRIETILNKHRFDAVLFEYWHAAAATKVFHAAGIPCILDMHDILWQSYRRQLSSQNLPQRWRERQVRRYREQEEAAWSEFDSLITINMAEHDYVRSRLPNSISLFYAPMGVDLKYWFYSWQPAHPLRVAYYGGLGGSHNQHSALRVYENIMPLVWQEQPDVELWLVGSNPPDSLRTLEKKDKRVHVTGFVQEIQDVLRTMTMVICPWIGRYGFRSRLVEVMALGVPVVTTHDAIYGMNMEHRQGLLVADTDDALAEHALSLLQNSRFAKEQSQLASNLVKRQYSFENTYGRLARELKKSLPSLGKQI